MKHKTTREDLRLHEAKTGEVEWKKWGPYLSERAWGTVREDYSPYGSSWDYTTRRAHVPIDGMKMDWEALAMTNSGYVLGWRFGMNRTRFSKNGSSA